MQRGEAAVTITIVRDEVLEISVDGALLGEGWGYVHIEHFSRRCAQETALAIDALEEEGPLEGLVLDLRDNPGGLITEAVELVDLFVDEGLIVQTRGRGEAESWYATASTTDRHLPLVVLVNGSSASASELVAGALRDLGRADLVGTATFGKGSMQQVYEFEDGSALKLTVARYYLPSGQTIEPRQGLLPDLIVPMQPDPAQQLRAELEALPVETARREALLALMDSLSISGTTASVEIHWSAPVAERLESDPQLAAAYDRLRKIR